MIVRTVLAVAVTVALLGVAIPIVDDARVQTADRAVRADVSGLERVAARLLAADEPTPGGGPRRTVPIRLPRSAWNHVRAERVTIGQSVGEDSAAITYRLHGHERRRIVVEVPLRGHGGDPVVLKDPGRHELRLSLRRVGNDTVVQVRPVTP